MMHARSTSPFTVLVGTAAAHALLAAGFGMLLLVDAPPILGLHPAWKPAKFAVSIAIFLGTMALLVPALSLPPRSRLRVAWILAATMIVEMIAIAAQAARGARSHFNVETLLDVWTWRAMVGAISIATLTMAWVAIVATWRPLQGPTQRPLAALQSLGWRAGLWIFQLSAVSGFAMGGRLRHSVGGVDGGPGLPLVDWSTLHGDLRVSHFLAVHALQVLPLAALMLERSALDERSRLGLIHATALLYFAVCAGTLVQAALGLPLL